MHLVRMPGAAHVMWALRQGHGVQLPAPSIDFRSYDRVDLQGPDVSFGRLVGPLVTQETGDRISDHPALVELSSRFVPL
jgi:hypothetical protein